jgi:hypothetical protein
LGVIWARLTGSSEAIIRHLRRKRHTYSPVPTWTGLRFGVCHSTALWLG